LKFLSEDAKSIVTGLLERKVNSRLGCGSTGAAEIKEHPFFAGLDWQKVRERGGGREGGRRGGGSTGAAEIKKHPFFAGLDWQRVRRRERSGGKKENYVCKFIF